MARIIIVILLFTCSCFSQENVIQLKQRLTTLKHPYDKGKCVLRIIRYYHYKNIDSLAHYIAKLDEVNASLKNDEFLANQLLYGSHVHNLRGNEDEGWRQLNEADSVAGLLDLPVLQAKIKFSKSNYLHYRKKDYTQALKYKLVTASLLEKIDSVYFLKTQNLNAMAFMYIKFANYPEALKCIDRIKRVLIEDKNDNAKGYFYNLLGILNCELKDYETSYKNFDRAIALFELNNNAMGSFIARHNKAETNYFSGRLSVAKTIFEAHLKQDKKFLVEENIPVQSTLIAHLFLGRIALAQGNEAGAIKHWDTLAKTVQKYPSFYDAYALAALEQSQLFRAKKQFKNALKMLNVVDTLKLKANQDLINLEKYFKEKAQVYANLNNENKEAFALKQSVRYKNKYDSINSALSAMALNYLMKNSELEGDVSENKEAIDHLVAKMNEKDNDYLLIGGILGVLFVVVVVWLLFSKKKLELKRKLADEQQQDIANEKEKLEATIDARTNKLKDFALLVQNKNEFIESVKQELFEANSDQEKRKLLSAINKSLKHNKSENDLYASEDEAEFLFATKLTERYPDLNEKEKRIAIFIRLGYNSKDMSDHMGISKESVNNYRYTLRKKIGLERSQNLTVFLKQI